MPNPSPHRARKRFGQNFLHDPGTIGRLLAAIDARPGEYLVEIGPGQGALTGGLLRAAGRLDAIELDRDLIAPLQSRFGGLLDDRGQPGLRLHQADALRFELATLVPPGQRLRLVGNLPYNLSTPLLFRFLEQLEAIEDLHLMLQREVVERIVAPPGGKVYGRLSVMVQTHCAAASLLRIGPGAFHPAPRVDSAWLRLRPWRPTRYPLLDPAHHARLVAAAFAQRRKTLRNSLAGQVSPDLLEALGLDPGRRAETLSVADFAALANAATLAKRTQNPEIDGAAGMG